MIRVGPLSDVHMMADIPIFSLLTSLSVLILTILYARRRTKTKANYPPGPKGLPIVGNALQVPQQHLATYFRQLVKEYGELVSLNIFGSRVLIIGDMQAAKDILDRRSAKFSSRPSLPYIVNHIDPTGAYWGFHPPTEDFQVGRRLTAGVMSSVRAGLTEPLQHFETLWTVQNLLDDSDPEKWHHHITRLVVSTAFSAGFGVHFASADNPDMKEALYSINTLTEHCHFSASIINLFPFLDWLPGPMPWRKRAKEFRERDSAFYSRIIREAVSGKASGMNTWAAAFAKEDTEKSKPSRFMNQFSGGAFETTGSSLKSFVLACVMYPEWVQKAQKQLDDIVGPDRLPTFSDRPRLPYIDAVVREILRWRPALRAGVPHLSVQDDVFEYKGQQYFIPAGTTVFALAWAIEHDQTKYTDCDRFNPDRFLDENGKLRTQYETSAFGFGRRVCPGSPFGDRALWIAAALILWTFNIQKSGKPDPKTGLPFQYDVSDSAFIGDLTNPPIDFPAIFSPRSARHAEVARQEWEACEKDLNVLLPVPKS